MAKKKIQPFGFRNPLKKTKPAKKENAFDTKKPMDGKAKTVKRRSRNKVDKLVGPQVRKKK